MLRASRAGWILSLIIASSMLLVSCDSASPTPTPTQIVLRGGVPSVAVVGAVAGAPVIEIQAADGRGVRGVPFAVLVEGGGTLSGGSRRSESGPTSIGTWTLGMLAGEQALTVTADGLPALRIVLDARPGPAASMVAVGAVSGLSAEPNGVVPGPLAVLVKDSFGNAVPGVPVTVTVSDGGTVSALTLQTDGAGRAAVDSWRLGPAPGAQTLTFQTAGVAPVRFTARANRPFTIELRFIGEAASATVREAFVAAADRVGRIITHDIPPFTLSAFDYAAQCDLPGATVLDGAVDDLVVYVAVMAIDGPGRTIGLGGPCIARPGSILPIAGDVILDSADLPALIAAGQLGDVVLHELLHVVGIGTIWGPAPFGQDRVSGYGGGDPQFTGPSARAAFAAAGGAMSDLGVPVENLGGAGTRDAHWRESVLGAELMTGTLQSGQANPLSAITIAALGDLGYGVSLTEADAFSLRVLAHAVTAAEGVQASMAGVVGDVRALRFVARPDGGLRPVAPSR